LLHEGALVHDKQEEWLELCKQASVEQNPEKLSELVRRISDLLEAKDRRLQANSVKPNLGEGDRAQRS
jgi:hypothetical protein